MPFLFLSLAVVVLLVFVVVALDPREPELVDLSALDDGGLLPAVVAERDRSIEDLARKSLVLDEAVLRFETAERRVADLEGAQAVMAAAPATASRTYVAEVSTVVSLKEAEPAESGDGEDGEGGSSARPAPGRPVL